MNAAGMGPSPGIDPKPGSPCPAPPHVAPLDERTFQSLRTLLHQRSGIALASHKIPMVQSRLNKRLRHLGIPSYEAYLQYLQGHPEAEEWTHFINALTTNLTRFFRESHHFHRLVQWFQAHPDLAARPRIWSAGCSTGEEPYTLAMTLRGAFPQSDIRILATDLDSNVLAKAAAGTYSLDSVEDLDPGWLRSAFLRGKGANQGKVRIRPEIQALVEFRCLNLLAETWSHPTAFQAVFCRNVMIYFDKPTQRRLLQRFRQALIPGGLLVVGHSEALLDAQSGFTPLGETMYERKELP